MERPATDAPLGDAAQQAEPLMPADPVLLRATELRVQYGRFLAVAGVSLEVRGGELLGLVGPNGAGKTTLLRSLAGLQATSAGAIWVLGQRLIREDAETLRHVGFTADEPPLYEAMTVRTFLRFIAAGYGSTGSEVDERIDFWLEKLWLSEKAEQPIKALSRGMRQRLGIARTLLPNPHVILLDEPAAGLDPAGRAQFRELLITLRQQGKALIVSSHILSDLAEYCSHVAIMARGEMLRYGTVDEVAHAQSHGAMYFARLATVPPGVLGLVQAIPGVETVRLSGEKLEILAPAGKDQSARLLSALISAGLPVFSFGVEGGGLEQAYLRTGVGQVD